MTVASVKPRVVAYHLTPLDIVGTVFPAKELCHEVWEAASRSDLGDLNLPRLRTMFAHMVESGQGVWMVAGDDFDGMLAGAVVADLYTGSPVAQLSFWWVREAARHMGVGGVLLEAFETWARERDCVAVYAQSLVGQNTDAFFESREYSPLERVYLKEL